jgi:hypothetical protein
MRTAVAAAALLVGLLVGPALPAGAGLIGVAWDASSSEVFTIPEAGPGAPIGLSGVPGLNALTTDPAGTLWSAVVGRGNPLDGWLVEISATTGAATPIAKLDLPSPDVRGLAFDLAGTLYFLNDATGPGTANGADSLYRVTNIENQMATTALVGLVTRAEDTGNHVSLQALAFSPSGELFGYDVRRGLINIDPTTAVGTNVSGIGDGEGSIQAIGFLPDGRLLAARDFLWEMSPTTGELTLLGAILEGESANIRGLASTEVIPEPGTWALVLLGLAALRVGARRRPLRRA